MAMPIDGTPAGIAATSARKRELISRSLQRRAETIGRRRTEKIVQE
jgi:hypothetical protein